MKVLTLWTPLLKHDNPTAAQQAASYLPDSRVHHFWDLWGFANRSYSKQLNVPQPEAWDLFVLYRPNIRWSSSMPVPTYWMQHRNLEIGEPYTQEKLEAQLRALTGR